MRNYYLLLLGAFFMLAAGPLSAQTIKQFEKAADQALEDKNFYDAMRNFDILLESKPEARYWFGYAEAARQLYAYTEAERAYEQVALLPEKKDFPLTDFLLGGVKKQLGRYEEAQRIYKRYMAEMSPNDYYYQRALEEIRNCEWAAEQIKDANEDVLVQHLDERINSPYTDFGGVLLGDTILYSAMKYVAEESKYPDHPVGKYYSKIIMAPPGEEARDWDQPFNRGDKQINAHVAFNKQRNRLYFNQCEYLNATDLACELYVSERQSDGNWGRARRLPDFINVPGATTTQPSVGWDRSRKREVLYFASDRPGGAGQMDIWYAVISPDGELSQPINLAVVNTPENEVTPFFHNVSQTLYFSSDGRKGFGGFDIYQSGRKSDGFQPAEHLKYPINSSYNDLYYSLNENGAEGLFASNRPGSFYLDEATATCCNDLYTLTYESLDLRLLVTVYDGVTGEPISDFELTFRPDREKPQIIPSGTDTYVEQPLEPGRTYDMDVTKKGYRPKSLDLSTIGVQESQTFEREVYLFPNTLPLKVLTFDADTGEPLTGVRVDLYDREQPEESLNWDRNFETNELEFVVDRELDYLFIGEKDGYLPDSSSLSREELELADGLLIRKLYLKRKPSDIVTLSDFLPVTLYFDNDSPDRRTRRRNTDKTYGEAFSDYYARKPEYIRRYTTGLSAKVKRESAEDMRRFFEEEVRLGYEKLQDFLSILEEYLQAGNRAELLLKGYASPRAESDYNERLTARRISALMNEIRAYRGGVLRRYEKKGQLIITERPYGESQAPQYISDDLQDERNSIFSVDASRQRRTEVIEVKSRNER